MALILIGRSRIMKVFFNSLRRFMKPSETMKTGKKYSSRLPGLFTALSFVVYSSQATATIYRAYRMWRNGWAQAYGKGWEERIAVLKDESVKNPVFHPLNYVELLMYTDLQPENGYVWVNSACAEYYGKESVTVTIGE